MSRHLWDPPQLRLGINPDGTATPERRATWLELFFDLVFVVAMAELSHSLSKHLTLSGVGSFLFLFVAVWWCWIGATFYSTRFDTDDLGHRLLTLLQMAFVVTMAVNIPHAFDRSAVDFALSYTAFRGLLVFQYLNAGHYNPPVRPLTQAIAKGFSFSVGLWLLSVLVPSPLRFWLWGVGLVIELLTPLLAGRYLAQFPPSFSHIPERFGLFTMIVLGEAIWAVVGGLSDLPSWGLAGIGVGLLGLVLAFSFWWMYFDTIDSSALKSILMGQLKVSMGWIYLHLPLSMGLVATGVAIEHGIKGASKALELADRWLLCGGVGVALLALAGLHRLSCKRRGEGHHLAYYRLCSAAFVLVLGLAPWTVKNTLWLVALVAIACVAQVVLGLVPDTQRHLEGADP
jgi:low temperature requirement protein LtrA